MKEAPKRLASEAFAQMLAVTAMLVIASFIFYTRWRFEHLEPLANTTSCSSVSSAGGMSVTPSVMRDGVRC